MTTDQAKAALYNQYLRQRKKRLIREARKAEREYYEYRKAKELQFCRDARNRRVER